MHELHHKLINCREDNVAERYKTALKKLDEEFTELEDHEQIDYYTIGSLRNSYKHFKTKDEATDYLYQQQSWNESLYATYDLRRSSKYITLKKRLDAEIKKLADYEKEHSCSSFKAALISCSCCNSKINKKYIEKDICPVCGTDLRSKTTIETVERYRKNIKQLTKELLDEEKAMETAKVSQKNIVKGTMLLIAIDTHV